MTINDLLLNEEILGNTAIVYRNGDTKFAEYLSTGTYESGKHYGTYYGKGIYCFYSIENTSHDYGPILYKLRVKDLNNFFIFDYNIYKKVNSSSKATPENFIDEQNKKFNIPKSMYINKREDFAYDVKNNEYIRNKISGFIYSDGKIDKGGVLVAFRYYSLIPLAKSNDQGKTWLKIDTTHDYRKNANNLNNEASNKPVKKSDIFITDSDGNINCGAKDINSIFGSPEIVNGDFICSNNKGLTSLKGGPKKVKNFECWNCSIESLDGSPEEVTGEFMMQHNNLTSLKGGPKKVKGEYTVSCNHLINLEGAPETVNERFNCNANKLTSLKGSPKIVNGNFTCADNKLTSLDGGPEVITGCLDCTENNISKEELIKFLKSTKVKKRVYTDYGTYISYIEAMHELSGGKYFNY